jgi:predicted P-loop ATPase
MSALPILAAFGGDLTPEDYRKLAERAISATLADDAGIRRVDSYTAREMFGRKTGDLAGLIIPNVLDGKVREYRLRLDKPPLEQRIDGTVRECGKYIQPAQRGNTLYFPPSVPIGLLSDISKPVVFTEGEFKALALSGLGGEFLPVSIAGVNNWRGVIGKTAGPNGERRDVKGVIPDFAQIDLKGRKAIIAFDADSRENPNVRGALWRFQSMLLERGAEVGVLEWPATEGKGIDDRIAKLGATRVLADLAQVEFGSWRNRLLKNDKGKLLACYDNAALLIEHSPEWAGVLGFNEFTGGIYVLRTPPSPITANVGAELQDHFDTEAVRWMERSGVMVTAGMVQRVIDAAARRNPYHPVRDYLEGLPAHDGVRRLYTWLIDYCTVESSDANPNLYAMEVGKKILIAAVARIFQPGCKSDHLLVLEGPQDRGKSTAVRILAGDEFFTDQLADIGGKDASMQLRGKWIIELGELSAFVRSEMERMKSFISAQTERFRLPYGKRVAEQPRQCIFIGTTNGENWLKDETGGRRFWPVRCRGHIDLAGLRRDRDQLWAEALQEYRAGATWWLDDQEVIAEAIEQQRGRYQEDVWQELVKEYAESSSRDSVSIPEILTKLGVETAKQDQRAANRVAACLTRAGWEKFRKRTGGGLEWRYRRRVDQ